MPERGDASRPPRPAPAGGEGAGGAAWLRLLTERDGGGIRAALFRTSCDGEPVAFCFARATPRHDGRRAGEDARPDLPADAVSELAASLIRSTSRPPALILCLRAEALADACADWAPAGARVCLVGPPGDLTVSGREPADGSRTEAIWMPAEPERQSAARRLFEQLMHRDAPLEPFERAARALNAAFDDQRVQTLSTLRGLMAVVHLSPPDARPARRSDPVRDPPSEAAKVHGEPRERPLAERLWALLAAAATGQDPVRRFHLPWAGELMPFQLEGVRVLLERDRLLLADDMGLGKTLQAIAALRILRAQGAVASCLVAAPASLLDQWRREIGKWAPEMTAIIVRGPASDRAWQWAAPVDVTLVSYDTLRADFAGAVPALHRAWDVVVADEAQRLKNRNETSGALKALRRTRCWALTGTPIENHEEELASILEFVDHDGAGPPRHYRPGQALLARHRELQLRRRKADVLDHLPPKQVTKAPIRLGPRQRRSYDKAEQEGVVYLRSLGAEIGVRHVLELITRLKQICNADPQTGESAKLEDVRDRLEQLTAQGHKALVFSQYTNDTSGVAAACRYLRAFEPLSLTGGTPPAERITILDRFRADRNCRVLVLSLRAGGLGLNLQDASYVFHLDRWWNPAVERQAEDRSHRLGQTVKVNVIKYSCVDTIEERIDTILERKQMLFDDLIDDVSLDLSERLSPGELFSLFGMRRPPAG